jgi:hypothetical protein
LGPSAWQRRTSFSPADCPSVSLLTWLLGRSKIIVHRMTCHGHTHTHPNSHILTHSTSTNTSPYPTIHYSTYPSVATQHTTALPDPTLLGYSIVNQRLLASNFCWGQVANSFHIPTVNPDPEPTLHYPTRLGLPNFGYSAYPYPTQAYITWLLNRVPATNRFKLLLGTSCEWLARLSLVYVAWYKRVIASIVCSAQCVHG